MFGLMMDYPLTLDRIVERANRLFPHKRVRTKQLDGSLHDYTYAELYRRSRKLASVLAGLGIESADRIGTFAWNHYQRLERHFGIPGAGAVCHPIHVRLFPGQLAYIVNHAEDRLVFVDASVLPLYEKVARETSGVEHHILVNAPQDIQTDLPNVRHYEELIDEGDDEFEWRCTDEAMAMGLCYTSGTTGDPKGALYSHAMVQIRDGDRLRVDGDNGVVTLEGGPGCVQ